MITKVLAIKNKVALVTGGGRGLGRVIAKNFAKEGCRVALCDIDEEGVKKVAGEISDSGAEALPLHCDITRKEQIGAVVEKIESIWKTVDILINNAAVLDNISPIEKMKDDLWLRDIDVNLTGTYYITRACFKGMKAQKWGRIASMSSVAGAMGGFGQAGYSASKGGVSSLMKTLALEGGRFNITANSIVAGIIRTEAYDIIREDMRGRLEKRTVFNRPGRPQEIADIILYLCSEKASYITGNELFATGGIHLFTF